MAVAYGGAGTATFADNAAPSAPSLPTGWAVGSLLVSTCGIRHPTANLAVGAGWNLVGPFRNPAAFATTGGGVSLYLAWRIATSGQAAPTWTPSGGATGATVIARTYYFTDAAGGLGTPGAVYAPSTTFPTGTGVNFGPVPSVDVPPNGAAIAIGMISDDQVTANVAVASGWTTMLFHTSTLGNDASVQPQYKLMPAGGATGPASWQPGPTGAGSHGVGVQIPVLQTAQVSSLPLVPIRQRRLLPLLVR